MKTLLVPTDFSLTATNAAHYAIDLAIHVGIEKVVLYHGYQILNVSNPMIDQVAVEPYRTQSMKDLEAFKDSLGNIPSGVELELFHGSADLSEGINEVCDLTNADAIIMGITGGGIVKETLFGSNTLKIAKDTTIPVIIVPATAKFSSLKSMVLLSDFEDVAETTPTDSIKNLVQLFKANLSVLHIHTTEHVEQNTSIMDSLFSDVSLQYHFVKAANFTDAIIDFTRDNNIDILIAIPKYHGILEQIFTSHTKHLAFTSTVPLMLVHK